ncbi:hypothetical protein Tco_0037398, partial [Tanacetum coccineum]
MPLGEHAAHWANYLGELVRELPLHYLSWRQVPAEQKAGVVARIGPSLTCVPTWNPIAGHLSMRPSSSIYKRSTMARRLLLRKSIRFLTRMGLTTWIESDNHVPRTLVDWYQEPSPYEDLSDIGSPGAEGPIFQDPPSPDYVPGPEEPEQAPPSPIYVPFVPEPVYPELLPEDDVLLAEEQPLPVATSPTTESSGYIPESDPEEDPEEDNEEDPEEDPAHYPADKGDDRDDKEPSDDDDNDDDDAEE